MTLSTASAFPVQMTVISLVVPRLALAFAKVYWDCTVTNEQQTQS